MQRVYYLVLASFNACSCILASRRCIIFNSATTSSLLVPNNCQTLDLGRRQKKSNARISVKNWWFLKTKAVESSELFSFVQKCTKTNTILWKITRQIFFLNHCWNIQHVSSELPSSSIWVRHPLKCRTRGPIRPFELDLLNRSIESCSVNLKDNWLFLARFVKISSVRLRTTSRHAWGPSNYQG